MRAFTFFFFFLGVSLDILLGQELDSTNAPQEWEVSIEAPRDLGVIRYNSFANNQLEVFFRVFPNVLSFSLQNENTDTLYLLWNDCRFYLEEGQPASVVHSKLSYENRNRPLVYEVISPKQKKTFFLAPRSKADWNSELKKWRSFPMLEGSPRNLLNKTFGFDLVYQSGENKITLPFVFRLEKVEGLRWTDVQREMSKKNPTSPTTHSPEITSPKTWPKNSPYTSNKKEPSEPDFSLETNSSANLQESPPPDTTKAKQKPAPNTKRIEALLSNLRDLESLQYDDSIEDSSTLEKIPLRKTKEDPVKSSSPKNADSVVVPLTPQEEITDLGDLLKKMEESSKVEIIPPPKLPEKPAKNEPNWQRRGKGNL